MSEKADVGLVGLAVMGQNLALNIADNGYSVAVHNRTQKTTDDFVANVAQGIDIRGSRNLDDFVAALSRPRKVILMVRAGEATDATIGQLLPLLDPGDVLVDCGNSHYEDTVRRLEACRTKGIHFVGSGVSGGEDGARHGPSIMPGGDEAGWPELRDVFQAIAAKVDGEPCCEWIGRGGAGHYVKMVHNGIEYGDMQLIAEAYDIMYCGLGMTHPEMAKVFDEWNRGRLDSYLIEITRDILDYRDEDGSPLLESILDAAGQKGTGKWTGISALELGMPVSIIGEAVFARCLSARVDERKRASTVLGGKITPIADERAAVLVDLEAALYASKLASYAQGFMLLREASQTFDWALDYAAIAMLWRGGCIIRSRFLGDIRDAYRVDPSLENLLLSEAFSTRVAEAQSGWRRTVSRAVMAGVSTPGLAAGLSFFDGYRAARGSANLIQAQRDYFGSHTYERTDRPRGEHFHTDWIGSGALAASGTYSV